MFSHGSCHQTAHVLFADKTIAIEVIDLKGNYRISKSIKENKLLTFEFIFWAAFVTHHRQASDELREIDSCLIVSHKRTVANTIIVISIKNTKNSIKKN